MRACRRLLGSFNARLFVRARHILIAMAPDVARGVRQVAAGRYVAHRVERVAAGNGVKCMARRWPVWAKADVSTRDLVHCMRRMHATADVTTWVCRVSAFDHFFNTDWLGR
jgi:hypothetical protein